MAWVTGKRGAYRVQWREGGRGSPVKSSRLFHDRSDADAELRAVEERLDEAERMSTAPHSSDPIPTLIKRHNASRLATGTARQAWLDESTAYVTAMAKEMDWTRVTDITYGSLDAWRSKRPGGKGTDKPLQALKGFLRWCDQVGVRVDPRALKLPPRHRVPRPSPALLTDGQMAAILLRASRFGDHYVALLEHLALYACRPIDCCRLQVRDWQGEGRLITYRATKNKHDITHPVHEAHAARLDALVKDRAPDEAVFLHFGQPWAIDKGKATQLASWYYHNITDPMVMREINGHPTGCLHESQRGIQCIKDYAMTKLAIAARGDRRAVVTISGHRSLTVVDRYIQTNVQTQRDLISAVTLPA